MLSRLQQSIRHYQLHQTSQLVDLHHQLQRHDPARRLQQFEQRFDEMQMRLHNALQHRLNRLAMQQQQLHSRLQQCSPVNSLKVERNRLQFLASRFDDASKSYFRQADLRLQHAVHQLETVSPLSTLTRGYSITKLNDCVVTDSSKVSKGDVLTTQLKQGSVRSSVI